MLFKTRLVGKAKEELYAVLPWYETDGAVLEGPRMTCLSWATHGPAYDVAPAGTLQRLVVLQPHPGADMSPDGMLVHNFFFDSPQ